MAREVYLTTELNGEEYANKIAAQKRIENPGATVTVEHGQIPQWGSAIPTSSTYGKTELGYRIIVENHLVRGGFLIKKIKMII